MLSKLKVKYIQSLGQKKFRDEESVFIAEGPKIVNELLAGENVVVRELFATAEWLNGSPAQPASIAVNEVSAEELRKISQLSTPHQVLAVVEQFAEVTPVVAGTLLALDQIQDPGNLGTIIRISDWFGISQVLCNRGCADLYNPKVVQATMGSIARVQVCYLDLATWITSQENITVYAAGLDGQDVTRMHPVSPAVILIGNESRGLDPGLLALADARITIPRRGKAESLNAAVATGIILSHLC